MRKSVKVLSMIMSFRKKSLQKAELLVLFVKIGDVEKRKTRNVTTLGKFSVFIDWLSNLYVEDFDTFEFL